MATMGTGQEALQQRIDELGRIMPDIRRQMEGLLAENQRLKEVVRLAEGELRNRRDQVQQLQEELRGLQEQRREARARVEHAVGKLDAIIAHSERTGA